MAAFKNGVALITGGARGMGAATSRLFAERGAKVMIGDIREDLGEALADELRAQDVEAQFRKADVTREGDVKTLVQATIEEFGRIDFAVNCAGVGNKPALIHEMDLDNYERTMAINATGVFLCLKHELAAMLKTGGGAIVNISSGAGQGGFPRMCAYSAAKHACIALTRTAALEYVDKNIRVNSVAPGAIDTPLNEPGHFTDLMVSLLPMKRMGTPREIAETCVFLCSEGAGYITGQVVGVCGGYNRVSASGVMPSPESLENTA